MTDLAEPVVILSDVHLNARHDWARKLDSLRPLWNSAATVVFNGDTLNSNLSKPQSRRHEVLAELHRICQTDGVTEVLISGNSDYHTPAARRVFLTGGRILVLHGEVLFKESSPWRREADRFTQARLDILSRMNPARRHCLDGRLEASLEGLRLAHAGDDRPSRVGGALLGRISWHLNWLIRPRRILTVLRAWKQMPLLAAEFLENYAPRTECIIIGHAHHRGIWRVRGRTVINTGSFEMPSRPLVVRVHDGVVHVHKVARKRGLYLPGVTVTRYTLADNPPGIARISPDQQVGAGEASIP